MTALRPRFSRKLVDICASLICRRQGALGTSETDSALVGIRNETRRNRIVSLRVVISEDDKKANFDLKVIHSYPFDGVKNQRLTAQVDSLPPMKSFKFAYWN